MSTRSFIGILNGSANKSVYVHGDGFIEGMGFVLMQWMTIEVFTPDNRLQHADPGSLFGDMYAKHLKTVYQRRKFMIEWLFKTSPSGWSSIKAGSLYHPPVAPEFDDHTSGNWRMKNYAMRGEKEAWTCTDDLETMLDFWEATNCEYGYIFTFKSPVVTLDMYKLKWRASHELLAHHEFTSGDEFLAAVNRY